MKIFVTGGAGFIGSHLIDKLLVQKHDVISIDNFDTFYDINEKKKNVNYHSDFNNFKFIEGSITDKKIINEIICKNSPEIIIHLAANAGVRPSIENAEKYFTTNVNGTLNICEAMAKAKPAKFIFASSSSVYGINNQVPFSENHTTLKPVSPYAASKIAGEAICHTYSDLNKINTTALRFFTVFGTRQRPDLAIRKFIEKIIAGIEITLFGDGSSARDYTHVSDITDGIISAINFSKEQYSLFNLGNSYPIKLIDLVKIIEKETGLSAKINYQEMQAGDVPITFADISKAKSELGYNPKIGIEEGIKEMVQWIKEK